MHSHSHFLQSYCLLSCDFGSYRGRCVICGGLGVADAYYCKECTIQEKDRDGCPKVWSLEPHMTVSGVRANCPITKKHSRSLQIINLGAAKTDLFYERKKFGEKRTY